MLRLLWSWFNGWRLAPYVAPVVEAGTAYCQECRDWKPFDTIPAIPSHKVPAFPICGFCGQLLDLEAA